MVNIINEGKVFENNWKKSIPNVVYYMRIKDSPSSFGQDSSSVRFTLNNPYDTFVYWNYMLFPMELKSTKGTSISIQRDKTEKGKMIKFNQIEGLLEASKHKGVYANFIFDFRGSENTYSLDIKRFNEFLNTSDKKSINESDVVNYGGILIKKYKKRVHYIYGILDLLNNIKKSEVNTCPN